MTNTPTKGRWWVDEKAERAHLRRYGVKTHRCQCGSPKEAKDDLCNACQQEPDAIEELFPSPRSLDDVDPVDGRLLRTPRIRR